MPTDTDNMTCETKSWATAAAAGVVVFILAMWLFGWGLLVALVIGVVVLLVLGVVLSRVWCADSDGGASVLTATPSGGGARDDSATRPAASPQPQPAAVVPPAPDPEPRSDEEPREDETAPTRTEEAPPTTTTPAPDTAAPAGDAEAGAKPELLDAPRGAPDDLKRIKGVGPKLEEKLHGMGIYHYSQIAGWSADEVAWVDDQLNFRGRIERDGWIEQAKTLAAGGETEFSRRSDGNKDG